MIRLERAVLCLDESILFDRQEGPGCPRCGSAAVFPIARWLNRRAPITLTITPAEIVELADARSLP